MQREECKSKKKPKQKKQAKKATKNPTKIVHCQRRTSQREAVRYWPVPTWLGDNHSWNSVSSTGHLTGRETGRKEGNSEKSNERRLVKGKRFMRKDLKEVRDWPNND